ncbi:unnamed protein product [Kuraishia capsulata CBS 1993]|uniref:Uncharacterized protein n=1 Tax=Kuraishia capsulata CBS 1993 TaxID=1382522 RepID=W6MTU0_9ASCO|nr:unnamed protein product [Kuraishia capsulata CBS 1993]
MSDETKTSVGMSTM